MNTLLVNVRKIWFVVLVASLTACSVDKAGESYLKDAKDYYQNGKYNSAIISMKNYIKENPDDADARTFLAKIYLSQYQPLEAEKELGKASEKSAPNDERTALMSTAYFQQAKYDDILKLQALDGDGAVGHELALNRVAALFLLGKEGKAREEMSALLESAPDTWYSMLANAYASLFYNRTSEAERYAQKAEQLAPNNVRILLMNGDVSYLLKNYSASSSYYKRASELVGGNVSFEILEAKSLIGMQNYAEAEKILFGYTERYQGLFVANYLYALAKYNTKKYKEAFYYAEKSLAIEPENYAARLIAGISAYKIDNFEQAYRHFQSLYQERPGDRLVEVMLAISSKRLGQDDVAIQLFESYAANVFGDELILDAIGKIPFDNSLIKNIPNLILNSAEASPDEGLVDVMKEFTGIDRAEAITVLEGKINSGQAKPENYVALVLSYIKDNKLQNALKIAGECEEKFPDSTAGPSLSGYALSLMSRHAEAKEKYKKVLEIDPGDVNAHMNLALYSRVEGDYERAIESYDELISQKPGYWPAYKQKILVEINIGRGGDALNTARQAERMVPGMVEPKVVLAKLDFLNQEYQDALNVAYSGLRMDKFNVALNHIAGRAAFVLNRLDEAKQLFELVKSQPEADVDVRYYLAAIAEKEGRVNDALENYDALLSSGLKAPRNFLGKARVLVKMGRYSDALESLELLNTKYPGIPEAEELMGVIAIHDSEYSKAESHLKNAFNKNANNIVLAKLAAVLEKQNKFQEINQYYSEWLGSHPDDVFSRKIYGTVLLNNGFYEDALAQLQKVLSQNKQDYKLLNDIAWGNYKLARYDAALDFSKRAYAIADNEPQVIDTLGRVYYELGDFGEAKKLFEKAGASHDRLTSTDYYYALTLIKVGEQSQGVDLLGRLVNSDVKFEEREDAIAVLKQHGRDN